MNPPIHPSIVTPNTNSVKLTELLRRDVVPLPTKNPLRNVKLPGNGISLPRRTAQYVGANPILGYSHILNHYHKGDVSNLLFNLMADTNGAFHAGREIIYMAEEGRLMEHVPRGYKAIDRLESLKKKGVLKDYMDYSKQDAQAREAKLKTIMKGVSAKVIDFIAHILETDIFQLRREAEQALLELTNHNREIFHHPNLTPHQNYIAQGVLDLMTTSQHYKDQLITYERSFFLYKEWQALHGITVDLLTSMIDDVMPGHQKNRKNKILSDLIKRYGLLPPSGQSTHSPHPIKPIQPHSKGMRQITSNEPHNGLLVRALTISPQEETDHARCALKHAAAQVIVHELQPHLETLTHQIRENLKEYEDKDALDTRQRALMINDISPIPLAYEDKSMTSPRIYSKQSDNLNACRRDMKKAALNGLGAVDVDMKSCHTYLLLDKWPQHLTLLKEAMDKGTLWDIYRTHYEKHNYSFHKKAVKAMHYASVLGGGTNAFHQAIHRHNLDNPDELITNSDELIKVHKKSPIYKELKALINHIDKEWHGKELILETGEKFKVKGMRRYKDEKTGELKTDYGNLLTALSAYLQSKEVLLMSHIIIETRHMYIPLLWQHDGLTLIPKDSNYIHHIQTVLDEACCQLLTGNTKIPLEVTPIKLAAVY